MSMILAASCCCAEPGCFRRFERCPCSGQGPDLAIPCDFLENHPFLQTVNGEITIRYGNQFGDNICYHGDKNSSLVDPVAAGIPIFDPDLPYTILEDCDLCCNPPPQPCYRLYAACTCNPDGGASGPIYVPCDLAPPYDPNNEELSGQFIKLPNGYCYRVTGAPVYALPSGAVIITQFTTGYNSCLDCCGPPPPPNECPTECPACFNTYTATVPGWNIASPPCTFIVQAVSFPIIRFGSPTTCAWLGSADANSSLCCGDPPDCADGPYFTQLGVHCEFLSQHNPPGYYWVATGDSFWVGPLATANSCPVGLYTKEVGAAVQGPNTVTIS